MARKKAKLTAESIANHQCELGRSQSFMWDEKVPGLAVRATPSGAKAYVFQGLYLNKDVRCTIGSVKSHSITEAQARARKLQTEIDEGRDPRELKRGEEEQQRAREAKREADQLESNAQQQTFGEAWAAYLTARKPFWGERHYSDHVVMARAGGLSAQRGTRARGITIAGPIHPLLGVNLVSVDADLLRVWASQQVKTRPTVARLAFRQLRAFLRWCKSEGAYRSLLGVEVEDLVKAKEILGRSAAKQDALLMEQLPAWFAAVQAIPNTRISAYLQVLLLTGARPCEVLGLQWADVNRKWRGITIRDKVEGTRTIPLTPFVLHLIESLPRKGSAIFSSETAKCGVMTLPHHQHQRACEVAGIEGLTLHGLRRSFGSLTEWLEVPAGIVAQIQGHKPSATAEKHYRVRPLDLLRLHHERIEAWVLERAKLPPIVKPGGGLLKVVQ
jgi:integrase